jgi:hypothetical protein
MLKKILRSRDSAKPEAQPIIVVSGLPRSGTSMMMKMLAEGGLPLVTDSIRSANEDNPNGYFEFEPVKALADGHHDWLAGASGKAVKVVSALLEHLPAGQRYRILFMERELKEILASQHKMLERRREPSVTGDSQMEAQFREHVAAIKYWLARQPNMEVLYVDYNRMMADPGAYCPRIADFVRLPLDLARMRSVPNQRLYRNRVAEPPGSGPGEP